MAGLKNIEAARANAGSDVCWTLPKELAWEESVTGVAPGIAITPAVAPLESPDSLASISRPIRQGTVTKIEAARSHRGTPENLAAMGSRAIGPDIRDTQAI